MLRPIISVILGLAVIMSLDGCVSLLPKTVPAQLYRFGVEPPAGAPTPSSSISSVAKTGVVLGAIGFPRASTSDGILTVTGDETAYLGGVRWVAPARQLFTEAMQRAFEQKGQRTLLVDVGDVGPAGAILRVDVTSFEARYDHSGREPTVVVSLSARLSRSDGRLLDQRDFTASKHAAANSVSTIVRAFDQATDAVLTDVTGWTDAQVAALGPTAPSTGAEVTTTRSVSTSTTTTNAPHR